ELRGILKHNIQILVNPNLCFSSGFSFLHRLLLFQMAKVELSIQINKIR
ncbi:MAG: hypothetical protein ACI8YQ_002830, partial [Polaribacter sp.]